VADPVIGPPAPAPAPTPSAVPAGSVTLYDKETNAPVVVDAADSHAQILSGKYKYAKGTRVPIEAGGKIGTVDIEELPDAIANYGAKPVTGAQWHEHEQQQKYGSTPQAALAFGTAALDSATLGASNAVIGGIGGPTVREGIRGRAEANPAATTAGDVAGFIAPVAADVLSAGTLTPALAAAEAGRVGVRAAEKGLLRGAAETAILGPTRALAKVGDLAGGIAKGIVGHEAETAAGRVAQGIIAGGARGAVEGGVVGVAQEASKQYLQDDPDLTGEALGSAFMHGALIGGVLGGALHGVGGMLTKKAPKGLIEASEIGADEGAAKLPRESAITDQAAKTIISQVDDPAHRATLEKAWAERGPHGFAKHDELVGEATRSVVKSLDESLAASRIVDDASFGEAKAEQMSKLVPAENLAPVKKAATGVWDDATKTIDELDSYATKGGGEPSIKRLRKQVKDLITKTERADEPASVMMAIDSFKRSVGKETAYGTNPLGRTDAAHAFDALYDKIRLVLEDESVFGAGAVAQKEVNQATTDMLGTSKYFNGKYTVSYDSKAGVPIYRANDASIDGFMKGLTKPSGDLNTEAFGDKIARRSAFLDAVEKNYTFDAAGKAAIKTERKALASMATTIAKTSTEVAHVNQLKALLADEKGHGVGGIIGLALDSVTKPGLSLARLAELEAMKNRVLGKMDDGLQAVKRALGGTGERKKPGLPPHDHDTYEKRRAAVLHAAGSPDAFQAHVTGTATPISPHAPATAQSFQTAAMRTIQHLMQAVPQPPAPRSDSLTPRVDMDAWQPNDQQKSQFNRKFDIATHPEHALQLVADGTITPQHVETLQAANPAIYAKQSKALRAELDARTKPVPTHMQAPLKTFLGIPQMDPGTQKLMQASFLSPEPHGKAPHKPLKMADTTSLNAMKYPR